MDIGLNIAFDIRWLIPLSRLLTLEVDLRNYRVALKNGKDMRAWNDGSILR